MCILWPLFRIAYSDKTFRPCDKQQRICVLKSDKSAILCSRSKSESGRRQHGNTRTKSMSFFHFLSAVFNGIMALFSPDTRLHRARFAQSSELHPLLSHTLSSDGLLLGTRKTGFVSVRPTQTRAELGNILIVAPTRGGKGRLAV